MACVKKKLQNKNSHTQKKQKTNQAIINKKTKRNSFLKKRKKHC